MGFTIYLYERMRICIAVGFGNFIFIRAVPAPGITFWTQTRTFHLLGRDESRGRVNGKPCARQFYN